jgi:hypothetical protein
MQEPDIPPPPLNGGLYTGEPFAGPWRNHPALPDAGYLNHVFLQTAFPPPGAQHHVPGGGLRPGNNTPWLPRGSVATRQNELNVVCVPDDQQQRRRDRDNQGFAGHYYLH